MNKAIIILPLFSSVVIGMETSWSFFSSSKPKYIPEKIVQLRKEKAALEKKLSVGRQAEMIMWISPETAQHFGDALKNPKKFLQYLYYWERHKNERLFCIDDFHKDENQDALTTMQNYRLDGYSAFGAAVVAKDILIKENKKMIKMLVCLKLQPTAKDLNLAYLDLWEQTQEDSTRKALLYFGSQDENSGLYGLPLEIVAYIASFITEEVEFRPLIWRSCFKKTSEGCIGFQNTMN